MKNKFIFFLLFPILILSQESDICGIWIEEKKQSHIEIYKTAIIHIKSTVKKIEKHLEEIEDLGGMAKAIENGLPKIKIEQAAAKKQARIDSGKDIIVGVNEYQPKQKDITYLRQNIKNF